MINYELRNASNENRCADARFVICRVSADLTTFHRKFLGDSQAWRMAQILRCRDQMTSKLKALHDEDMRLSYSKAKIDALPGTIARKEKSISRPELDDVASALNWYETERVVEQVLVDVEKKKFRQFCNSDF
jgi:hypothetical protein